MRAQKLRRELQIGDKTIYPLSMGPVPPGGKPVVGEATDGNLTYSFLTGQETIPTIEVVVNKKSDRTEYNLLREWAKAKTAQDVFVSGRNVVDIVEETICLVDCQCALDEPNAMDRKGSDPDTQKFILLPQDIDEVK